MKVKCISNNGAQDYLTVGKIYQAETENCPDGALLVISDQGFQIIAQDFAFEVVEEQSSEWNGEGLPPVETVCEVSINNETYRKVEIVTYFDKTRSVVIYEAPWTPEVYEWDDCKFRPIKSEKDKEIEKISNMIKSCPYKGSKGIGAHFDTNVVAEYLYENGFRFVEN